MVEALAEEPKPTEVEGETSPKNPLSNLPPDVISSVAKFLPNVGKVRLSQISLYFAMSMQQHFRLMVSQELKTESILFQKTASEDATNLATNAPAASFSPSKD